MLPDSSSWVVGFQYNLDTITCTLTAQTAGEGDNSEAMCLQGPPQKKIRSGIMIYRRIKEQNLQSKETPHNQEKEGI
jgi:hypothetical protein